MKKLILTLVVVALPTLALAAETTPAKTSETTAVTTSTTSTTTTAMPEKAPMAKSTHAKHMSTMTEMQYTLNGVTDQNRIEIEKLAKKAGAFKASLDSKTGILKVEAKKQFNKDEFVSSLSKVTGVSLKE